MTENGRKRLPIPILVIIDALLITVFFGVFMLFEYFMPQSSDTQAKVVASVNSESGNTFALPNSSDSVSDDNNSSESDSSQEQSSSSADDSSSKKSAIKQTHEKVVANNRYDNAATDTFTADQQDAQDVMNADISSTELQHYTSDSADITITQKSFGDGDDKVTYYVADCYVTSADVIKSYFANDTYGKNIKSSIYDMGTQSDAVLAVNGDFYGNSEAGVVIRNGVEYRENLNEADICVLFTDGTMQTYSADEYNADDVISKGAWQAWCFGPALLDGSGNVLESFNTTSYLNSLNPRTAIGYIEPGHYVLVVVDGRDTGYSRGVTISELAAIMATEGCKTAYNLDGGKSSMMTFNNEMVNQPDGGGRETSDIIYIGG